MFMSDNEPSLFSSILVYTGIYLLLAILLNIVLWAAETYAGVVMSNSAVSWMPPVISAMQTGQRYGNLTGRKATNGYAWAVSFGFVVVGFVLSMAVVAGVSTFYGVNIGQVFDEARADLTREGISLGIIGAILGGVALLLWVLLRFVFNIGAGTAVKAAAAAATKAKR